MDSKPVIIEEVFDVPVTTIWEALTDKEKMKNWYFDLDAFEPIVGFEFRFAGKGHKGESYLHVCKVTEAVTGQKLQYTWQYEHYTGDSLVTFDLADENNKTRLRLTHEGLESFPAGNPDFARESFMNGWMHIITKSLRDYLATISPLPL